MSQTESGAAEQMVGFGIRFLDTIARLAGDGAKNLAAFTAAYLQNKHAEKGKTTFNRMIRDGKEMKVFQIPDNKKRQFARQCKKYGVLFAAVRDKKLLGKQIDILVRKEDASKVNRIIENLHLHTYDVAEVQSQPAKVSVRDRVAEKKQERQDILREAVPAQPQPQPTIVPPTPMPSVEQTTQQILSESVSVSGRASVRGRISAVRLKRNPSGVPSQGLPVAVRKPVPMAKSGAR